MRSGWSGRRVDGETGALLGLATLLGLAPGLRLSEPSSNDSRWVFFRRAFRSSVGSDIVGAGGSSSDDEMA